MDYYSFAALLLTFSIKYQLSPTQKEPALNILLSLLKFLALKFRQALSMRFAKALPPSPYLNTAAHNVSWLYKYSFEVSDIIIGVKIWKVKYFISTDNFKNKMTLHLLTS